MVSILRLWRRATRELSRLPLWEILRRRGAIRSAAIRAPGPKLDATDMAELDRLLARLAKKTGLGLNDFEKA